MKRHTILGQEKIGKLILRFSIPAIAGMAVNALYNVIDRIFVGRGIGSDALSGIAVTMPFMITLFAFAVLIAVGAAVRVSIKIGEKKLAEAEIIIGNAFLLSLLIGVALTVICLIFMEPILIMFGGSGDSLDYAEQFMQIILLATVFQMIGFTLNSAIRAEGNPLMALSTMLIGAVINTALNPLFIFVLHLGVRGSALATLISQVITSVWTLFYFLDKKNIIRLKIKNMRLKLSILRDIFSIGAGPFVLQCAVGTMLLVANHIFFGFGGKDALAVIGIIAVVNMLFNMLVSGISQGIQPIIGFNHGAKNVHRVKETLEISLLMATAICIAGFIPVFFFSREIMTLFSENNSYIQEMGATALKYSLLTLPLIGFQLISISYYQAVGKFMQALFLYMTRQLVIIIPLLLILSSLFGFYGGVAAFPISDIIITVITAVLIFSDWRKMTGTGVPLAVAEGFSTNGIVTPEEPPVFD
jgi:putative MATE family efflux protein